MKKMMTSSLGYPRIGEHLEWETTLEQFWSNQIDETALEREMKSIRLAGIRKQRKLGVDWIPSNDFTLYDHMLDMTAMFGLVPERFQYTGCPVSAAAYFKMAKGSEDAPACEMKRWFDTSYHYIVPELGGREPLFTENRPLLAYMEAESELKLITKPVVIGPFTYVKLSKGYAASEFTAWIGKLLPLYGRMLSELESSGAPWVQFDEPCLTGNVNDEEIAIVQWIYAELHKAAPSVKIMLQTCYGSAAHYESLLQLPVQGIGLDFAQGSENIANMRKFGFPAGKRLGIGILDGCSMWRTDLLQAADRIRQIAGMTDSDDLVLQPSSSLLHVPITVADESSLDPLLKEALSFADEKLAELRTLADALNRTGTIALEAEEKMRKSAEAVKRLNAASFKAAPERAGRFGEKPQRSATTAYGWVQCYGSRSVKPPIIYGGNKATSA